MHGRLFDEQVGEFMKLDKGVVTLGIPDDYECMDPQLIEELRARVSARLELPDEA